VRRVMFAVVLSLIAMAPAFAEVRIRSSSGGEVGQYLKLFSLLRQSGERIVIDGPCFSACTLVLSTIPRNRICVTPRAVLGFHAPQLIDRYGRRFLARDATRAVAASYPGGVRAWIRRHGGLTQKLIFLRGRQLAGLYPRC
jgi:hypothetical protein